eukprot:TRINITY_DN80681_c0_g1_i1.p1 TRINITY_DN80681_c0_g1~~TRINITY_DN80681_c0_g1_i1.p1  ORF type:complete len:387 (+),score=113.58 TRINITY_DN80681_c0_g1_i1:90-1250(+)
MTCRVRLAVSALGGVPGATAFHSSVLIDDEELSFSDAGISSLAGTASHGIRSPELQDLGRTSHSTREVQAALGVHFECGTYDLLRKNCNSFADCALFFLLGQRLPAKYRVLERFGEQSPALVAAISGGKYTPNPRAAAFDLEGIIAELDPAKIWRTHGEATGGLQAESAEAMRQARLLRFTGPGPAEMPLRGNSSGSQQPPPTSASNLADDERLAQQLAEEEERLAAEDHRLVQQLIAEEDERLAQQLASEEQRSGRSPADRLVQELATGAGQLLSVFVQGAEQLATALGPRQAGLNSTTLHSTTATLTYQGHGSHDTTSASSEDTSSAARTCSVCFEEFAVGQELRVLPCFHRYHKGCIDPWLREHRDCPVCKHPVSDPSGSGQH